MESLLVKKDKAVKMFDQLTKNVNTKFDITKKGFDKQIILPTFIK